MRHARADYDRIQDPEGKIPDDEPVFLIRGQDAAGPATVRMWAEFAKAYGADPSIIQRAYDWSYEMAAYQNDPAHWKVPDMPSDA